MNVFDAWKSGQISETLATPAGALSSVTPFTASTIQAFAAYELQKLGNDLLSRPELQEPFDRLSSFTNQISGQSDYLTRKSQNLFSELNIVQHSGKIQNLLNQVPESCADINAIAGSLTGAIDSVLGAVESAMSTLSSLVQNVLDQVAGAIDLLNGLIDSVTSQLNSVQNVIDSELSSLDDAFKNIDLESFGLGLLSTYIDNPCAKALMQSQVDPALLTVINEFDTGA